MLVGQEDHPDLARRSHQAIRLHLGLAPRTPADPHQVLHQASRVVLVPDENPVADPEVRPDNPSLYLVAAGGLRPQHPPAPRITGLRVLPILLRDPRGPGMHLSLHEPAAPVPHPVPADAAAHPAGVVHVQGDRLRVPAHPVAHLPPRLRVGLPSSQAGPAVPGQHHQVGT